MLLLFLLLNGQLLHSMSDCGFQQLHRYAIIVCHRYCNGFCQREVVGVPFKNDGAVAAME